MIREFLDHWKGKKVLFLELGVGWMTPMFIQEPFWQLTYQLPFACCIFINPKDALLPASLALQDKSSAIHEGIEKVFDEVVKLLEKQKKAGHTDSAESEKTDTRKPEVPSAMPEAESRNNAFTCRTERLAESGRVDPGSGWSSHLCVQRFFHERKLCDSSSFTLV